jgi:glycosyltransferase involved in cell wall biosynthesis
MTEAAAPLQISAVTTCKGRLAHLQETLPLLMAQPFHEVIVVDYDCPDGVGDWVAEAWPAARVVRLYDRPRFNAAKARNAGAAVATAPWLFLVDADVRVAPNFLEATFGRLEPGAFYVAAPRASGAWGTIFTPRGDFNAVGGYDEAHQGWGGEDDELTERLEASGLRCAGYDGLLVEAIDHDNDLRMRDHDAATPQFTGAVNAFYREMKRHLRRLGVTLDLPARERLYGEILKALEGGRKPETFEVLFGQSEFWDLAWQTSLKFKFVPARGAGDPSYAAPKASAKAPKSETE